MSHVLTGSQKATYDSIFRHPISHNIEWRSLIPIFSHLGDLEEEPNGKIKFSRNGQVLMMHVHGKDVSIDEVVRIRRFLQGSRTLTGPKGAHTNDALVVLDHSGARIFTSEAAANAPEEVEPLDPSGHDRQVHNPQGDSGGKQGPLRHLFHEALAKRLENVDRILLVGDGQGASSEVEHFVAELNEHHHEDLVSRIVGVEVADISHMTDGEFVAKARDFFASHAAPA